MVHHKFFNILEYIPVRYQGLSSSQIQDRKEVFNFKDGNISASLKQSILSKVRSIISSNPSSWAICFIPASTKAKTYNRFSSLALFLSREAGCEVFIDAISSSVDKAAGHISGKSDNPTADFVFNSDYIRGKKILLIDDVITRGRTFDDTAYKLERYGATEVTGLFVAKTIHPNLPIASNSSRSIPYDIFEEVMAEQAYEDEMAAELAAEEAYEDEIAAELAAEAYYDEYPDEF